jgi:hypothetical protein
MLGFWTDDFSEFTEYFLWIEQPTQLMELLLLALSIALNLWILAFLLHLEQIGCKCALDWRRYFIMAYIAITLVIAVDKAMIGTMHPNVAFATVMLILGAAQVVIVLTYVSHLERSKCECSEDVRRTVLKVVAIINAAAYALLSVLSVYAGLVHQKHKIPQRCKNPS